MIAVITLYSMISVCMATYNGEKYIKAQVESILSQIGMEDELIVSDDCSTDSTVHVLESFGDARIKIFINNRDKSKLDKVQCVTTNFEYALSKSVGDYIFLSDQDDVWHPDKVKIMSRYLQKYDYVQCACVETDSDLRPLNLNTFSRHISRNKYKSLFIDTPYMGCCTAVRRRLLNKSLPFPKGIQSHDRWLGFVAAFGFSIVFIPEGLVYYRRHGDNVSTGWGKSINSLSYRVKNRLYYIKALLKRLVLGS